MLFLYLCKYKGTYTTRDKYRIDTSAQSLWYTQKPIATTSIACNMGEYYHIIITQI